MGPLLDTKQLTKATPGSGIPIRELQEYLWNNSDPTSFTQVLNVNVTGVYFTTIAFLGLLEAGNKPGNSLEGVTSQVISISSIAAFRKSVT